MLLSPNTPDSEKWLQSSWDRHFTFKPKGNTQGSLWCVFFNVVEPSILVVLFCNKKMGGAVDIIMKQFLVFSYESYVLCVSADIFNNLWIRQLACCLLMQGPLYFLLFCVLSDGLKDIICKYELIFVLQLCSESEIKHKKGAKCYISCRSTAFLMN